MSKAYEFTEALQEKILSVLWKDVSSYQLYKDCVKPWYFKTAVHTDICKIIHDYWDKYRKPPTLDVLVEEVNRISAKSKVKQKLGEEYATALANMLENSLEDIEYVKEKIVDFGRKQAMIEAIIKSSQLVEKNPDTNYHKIEEMVKSALMVGEDVGKLGSFMFEGIEERITSYLNGEDVIPRITTGSQVLDARTKGGLGKSEMGVVIAPPGRGKTTFLIDKGAAALEAGYNVVHYSMENNEKQIQRNYDTRLMNKDFEYLKENTDSVIAALLRMKKYRKGELVIKKYPTKKATVDTIRAHLTQLLLHRGFTPDLVIIDYGSLLKPTSSYGERRFDLESVYEDIRALCDEFDCAIWTAAQGNRTSLSKKVVTMADLAECFAIANVADLMIALCQTKREKVKGIMRFFIAKQRDNTDFITLLGSILYTTKKIVINEEVLTEDENEGDNEESCGSREGSGKNKNWEGNN